MTSASATSAESTAAVLRLLAPHADPDEIPLVEERLGPLPVPVGETARAALLAALDAPRPARLTALAADARAARVLDDEVASALVAKARPARSLAALLGGAAADPGRPAAARLCELTHRHLGPDPDRWFAVHRALAKHRGTLAELLDAAVTPPGGPVPPPPRSADETFALLLAHAAAEDRAAVVRRLTGAPAAALLGEGPLPAQAVLDAVADHGPVPARVVLAGRAQLDARDLKRLTADGDPAVDEAVYGNMRTTPTLRRAIAVRAGAAGPDGPSRALRKRLLAGREGWEVLPLLVSGDADLTAVGLRNSSIRKAVQRQAVLHVWERQGEKGVRALLAKRPSVRLLDSLRTFVEGLLEDPGGAAGAAALRAACRADVDLDDPSGLPERLHSGDSNLANTRRRPRSRSAPGRGAARRSCSPGSRRRRPRSSRRTVRRRRTGGARRWRGRRGCGARSAGSPPATLTCCTGSSTRPRRWTSCGSSRGGCARPWATNRSPGCGW
ncbi:hypothetical protein BIV57_21180 [Mangrovactinospora gilvigrisea]|uniref:Uncharacterized protein n=1 Tax=Mangrovactinospora gilvigrisea TaxID=1428644 RepID=A0A1J7C1R9_9ACTN|nr:hypothetical protein [Mangrovactinospora gilvigrisea]OIV35512.1 hypothetical protein BIV57_21180 [Mangrovactinospora gilvigrisea]